MLNLNIPVGISDFSEIRKNNYYYVDKTALISELLKTAGTKVTLVTRPRRFGKTLGMSMLADFFDIRMDSREIFDGLEIAKDTYLCEKWRNKYPTIFLSFKNVDGLTFSSAYDMLSVTITELYKEHLYGKAAVFEAKYVKTLEKMEAGCEEALKQIDSRRYAEELEDEYDSVICYGIAFFKKRCLIRRKE